MFSGLSIDFLNIPGQDRIVTNKDRLNMPYTEAVLLETLRISNITPTGLPHTLEKTVEVDGKASYFSVLMRNCIIFN